MRSFNYKDQFESVKKSAVDVLKSIFPVEGKYRTLKIDNAWVDDNLSATSYSEQAATKAKEGTWGVPLYADLTLIDKTTGKIIDRASKVKMFNIPKITDRLSYIVKGNEYQVVNQLRLKPGVYTLRKQNGELKTQINISSKSFDLAFNEATGLFTIQKVSGGQANIPLYPVLLYLGMSPKAIADTWGQKIAVSNHNTDQKVIQRAEAAFHVKKGELRNMLSTLKISPETTKRVLGTSFDRVDGPLLLAASKNLLDVHLGRKEPVDRDSLEFKEIHSVEDFIQERLEKNKQNLAFKISRNIDNQKRVKISQLVNPAAFESTIEHFFTQDDKSHTPEQTNPLEMLSGAYKATIMGSGGIKSEHAITANMREIHPTQFGMLDPIHSPESNVGVNMHISMGAIKEGKELKKIVTDKNGKMVTLTAADALNKVIAFPGQTGPLYKSMHKGKVVEVTKDKVDYWTPNQAVLFSPSTNLIPFLQNDQGNRAMMASKMLEQAISLKNREAPLVQVQANPKNAKTMELGFGNEIAATSPIDGTVAKVTPDYILIKSLTETRKIDLYNNYALNRKSFLHHTPIVKQGDKVKAGQVLADSNYTSNGVLALGTNLKTAYIPYKGFNFDDGIVITESAAEKLTSEHIHKKSLDMDDNTILNLVAFKSNYPNALTAKNSEKMDTDGVVKVGSRIKMGEVIIAALRKKTPSANLSVLGKGLSDRPKNIGVYWALEDDATVIDVQKTKRYVHVMLKTEERAKIGDKLSNRHGGKGVITHIISDKDAPKNAAGEPVDMMLQPAGVISRINIGQIYESAVGKAAAKAGKPISVTNFTGENTLAEVKKLLDRHKIDDKEELFDPNTGKSLGKVHVGVPHILKLYKQSTSNFSVRQGGPGSPYDANMQPLKAGGPEASKALDLLAMYSLLSHGARANLREMATLKSSSNDEYWTALKTGQPLPVPKSSFAYEKFLTYLKGSGIDVKKTGTQLQLAPLTDTSVKAMSSGEIKKPLFYRSKDLKPIPGGFFDPVTMGGFKGNKWGHIDLKEPVLNPVFETAARRLTGAGKKLDEVLSGKLHVDNQGFINSDGKGVTAGAGVERLLKSINVDAQIAEIERKLPRAKGNALDDMNKSLRLLKALKESGLKPHEAYMRKLLPVVPAVHRPIYPLPSGDVTVSDLNFIYQNTGVINNMMKLPVMELLPESEKANIRADLYKHVKGLSGLTDMSIKGRPREGFIAEISGSQPKEGFFISKLLSKKQDFVGRGTIIPDSDLGIDEVGVPEEMAWKLFEPFVIRELVQQGKTPLQAKEEIKNKSLISRRALEVVLRDRHLLLNRAPSLHKFSIMALKPKIVQGRAIRLQPLVNKGFNADYNGDSVDISTIFNVRFLTDEGYGCYLSIEAGQLFQMVLGRTIEEMISDAAGFTAVYEIDRGRLMTTSIENGKIVESDVSRLTVHTSHGPCFKVKTHTGTEVIATEHHNFSYCDENLNLKSVKTEDMPIGMLIPKAKPNFIETIGASIPFRGNKNIVIDKEIGWLLGHYAGDGCACSGTVTFTETKKDIFEVIEDIISRRFEYRSKPQSTNQHHNCIKRIYSKELCSWLSEHCGHNGVTMKVPSFIFHASYDVKMAYVDGVIQSDGCISGGQISGNYYIAVEMLNKSFLENFRYLLLSMGIGSYIADSFHKGEKYYKVTIARKYYKDLKIGFGKKSELLKTATEKKQSNMKKDGYDIVPITPNIIKEMREIGAKKLRGPGGHSKELLEWRSKRVGKTTPIGDVVKKTETTSYVSRDTAINLIYTYGRFGSEMFNKWVSIVEDYDLFWERIEEVEQVDRRPVMFDLSVPKGEMFSIQNGILTHNTMIAHTPISDDANKEAEKMLPSRNLFQPGSGSLMVSPSQESQVGLYYLSKTSQGRARINKYLPKNMQITGVLDKKTTKPFLLALAKTLPPNEYGSIVKDLKNEGEKHAFEMGFTLGVEDLAMAGATRDKLMDELKGKLAKAKTPSQVKALSDEYAGKIEDLITKKLKDKGNPLYDLADSGAKGSGSNLRSILATPVMVTDAKGAIIAKPIKKSYSEGLDIDDYWTSMYGARRGMMDRSIQTSLPGAFSKDIMATTIDNVISGVDCGTKEGVELPVNSPDALDRFMAGDQGGFAHNTLVDSSVVSKLGRQGVRSVKVRSPLRCLKPKGTCSKCYGLDEHGHPPEVGDNIGAKAGQTISEPLVQLVMNAFHTGGTATTKGQVGGFARINQLLQLPKIVVGAAALSPVDGTVKKIVKGLAGGFDVTVGDKTVHVEKDLPLKVVVGQKVLAGDPLSEGVIKPQDLVKYKGMKAAQGYIASELQKAYSDQGVRIQGKVFETVVRSLGNTTKVLNNSKDSDFIPGDVAPYTVVEHHNKNLVQVVPIDEALGKELVDSHVGVASGKILDNKDIQVLKAKGVKEIAIKKDPIVHAPLLKGMSTLPLLKKNWMANLGYRYIAKNLREGAGEGWKTDISDYHPIPAFAYGESFGKGKEGKY